MAGTAKNRIKKIIIFLVLGLIAAFILVLLADAVLHYDRKQSSSYFGGFSIREETVQRRQCYCFYTIQHKYSGSSIDAGEVTSCNYEAGLAFYSVRIHLTSNLLADTDQSEEAFFVIDKDGIEYGGEWPDTARTAYTVQTENGSVLLRDCVGEVIFVNPDGSEEVLWRNEKMP